MGSTVYLGGLSAFEYWTAVRLGRVARPTMTRATTLRDCARLEPELSSASMSASVRWLSRPLDVLVPSSSPNQPSSVAVKRRIGGSLPLRSFCSVDQHATVVSPELCFLHLARDLPLLEAIMLAYEMCGRYTVLPFSGTLVSCPPLTSVARCERFLKECEGAHGIKQARRALRYAIDNSYSPMESRVAFLLSARSSMGGFGISRPELNGEMTISASAARPQEKSVRACDLLWREQGVAIEYDSSEHHESGIDIERDARRRNRLAVRGLTVLTVTRQQAQDFRSIEEVAFDVRKLLKERDRSRLPDVRQRRRALHRALFANYASPVERLSAQRAARVEK